MWGRRGAAISPEGVVYMVTGDAMFSPQTKSLGNAIVGARLDDNQQLQLVDYFAPPNANWMRARDLDMNVTPMAFDYRGRKFLVGTSKECRVWLLDRDALGGEDPPHDAPRHRCCAMTIRPSMPKACGVPWPPGRIRAACSGCSFRSGVP